MINRFLLILTLIAINTQVLSQEKKLVKEAIPTFPVTHFEKSHKQDKEITKTQKDFDLVLIGDSITNGWDGKPKSDFLAKAFPGKKVLNLGISGDVTQGVLWRIQDGVLDGVNAKAFMIMIGTNNIGKRASVKAEHLAMGISEIVKNVKLKVPRAKILLLGIFPRGKEAANKSRQKVIEVNEIIKNLHDGKSVFYKDLKDVFLNKDQTLNKNMSTDALHLSIEGYQAWANAVQKDLSKMMKDKKE